jgi:hypothetical protein
MAKRCSAIALAAIVMLFSWPAAAWSPDFDAAFGTFPHRGQRRPSPAVEVALPVARPSVAAPRPSRATKPEPSSRLAAYCRRPGKSSLSWIRVDGRKYYCPR